MLLYVLILTENFEYWLLEHDNWSNYNIPNPIYLHE